MFTRSTSPAFASRNGPSVSLKRPVTSSTPARTGGVGVPWSSRHENAPCRHFGLAWRFDVFHSVGMPSNVSKPTTRGSVPGKPRAANVSRSAAVALIDVPRYTPNSSHSAGRACALRTRDYKQTKPTPHKRRRSSPGERAQHSKVGGAASGGLVPRAGDPCTHRSRTRRHFSRGGRAQRGPRGDSFARYFSRGTQAGFVFWQHPRYKAKTTLRSPNRRLTGA